MKKYRVSSLGWKPKIEGYEVIKETPKTITYEYVQYDGKTKATTEYKHSTFSTWLDTFEEAKAYCVNNINEKIESYRQHIIMLEEQFHEIVALEDK